MGVIPPQVITTTTTCIRFDDCIQLVCSKFQILPLLLFYLLSVCVNHNLFIYFHHYYLLLPIVLNLFNKQLYIYLSIYLSIHVNNR